MNRTHQAAMRVAKELTADQRDALDAAHRLAYLRYDQLRRIDHLQQETAFAAAVSWGRNETEYAQRRIDHGTGATL